MSDNPIFQYSQQGTYPSESYVITPWLGNGYFNWQGSNFSPEYPYIFRQYLNHHKNPLKNIIHAEQDAFNKYINIGGSSVTLNNYPIGIPINNSTYVENVKVISFGDPSNSSITFYASTLRTDFIYPYSFYFFYFTDPTTLISNGLMFYPTQFFLNPDSLTWDGTYWNLNTEFFLLNSEFVSLSSSKIERDAYITHRARLSSIPNYTSKNYWNADINNQVKNFAYNIYASRMRYDYPIIIHSSTTLANILNKAKIDPMGDIVYIYPNSTFMSFSADYIDITDGKTALSLAQLQQNPNYLKPFQTFNPTFITSAINITDKTENRTNYEEIFQLIQNLTPEATIDVPLSDFKNSIYYVNIKNGIATPTFNLNVNNSAKLKAVKGSYIGFNYIADCLNMANLPKINKKYQTAIDTVSPSTKTLIDNNFNNTQPSGSINFQTKYPPHCYSYNVKVANSNIGDYVGDSTTLNFYLKLSANVQGNVATISAYIVSDFNVLQYGFNEKMYTESIAYQVISTSLSSINDFISPINNNLVCTFGPNNDTYKLTSSVTTAPPYVPVLSGKDFTITYNSNNFQNVSCVLKASLQTPAGQLDTYEPLLITFNPPQEEKGNGIFLNTVFEKSNSITLDSSFNISISSWPYVDLTNSNISWDWFNNETNLKDIPISFNYVDLSGNYIAPVDVGTPVPFADGYTQIVNVSGYGPNKITIEFNAYSVDYITNNPIIYDTISVVTDPTLFNYLEVGKFVVNPLVNLNNLNKTRTIQLSAGIPFDNKIYNIPSNIPIYWTWSYDKITDPNLTPITVDQILLDDNIEYQYSSNYAASGLSAIQINVTPGYSDSVPSMHEVTLTVLTDAVSPSISGSYTFYVDDFPDPNIFNVNFITNYFADQSSNRIIADTSKGKNIITRPDNSDLNFIFNANYTNNINCNNFEWTINDNIVPLYNNIASLQYNLDFTISNPLLSIYSSYGYVITAAKIGFNLLSATFPNWISPHNISVYTYMYIIDNLNFYTPLKFIIYPEYAWLSNNPLTAVLLSSNPLDSNYFTNAFAPSAYGNKISNSQTFWVSSNKTCFDEFLYKNLNNNDIIPTISALDLIDIPYNFNNAITSIPLSLVAYNSSFYDESLINTEYLIHKNGFWTTEYFQLTTQTLNSYPTNNVYNNFFLSPSILPYNDITLNFTVNQTSIELDYNKNISITQNLSVLGIGPAVILDGSTVTYYLSGQYWTVSATVPAINGTYSLFNLNIGDPSVPLYCGDGENPKDIFNLYAETNIIQQIPPSTFNNYLNKTQYTINPNLWIALSGI